MSKKLLYLMAFVVVLGMFSASALATDYHIDPVSGSDSTGDGSFGNPWETFANIQYYYSSIYRPPGWVQLQPGETIYLMNGTHNTEIDAGGGYDNCIARFRGYHGSSGSWFRIAAYPGHSPVIDGSGSHMGINVFQSSYWEIEGVEVKNCYARGILIAGDTAVKVHNVHIHDTDGVDNNNIAGLEVNGTLGFELYDSVLNDNYDRICADTGGNATENSANVVFFSNSGDIIIRDCEFYQSLPLSDPKSGGGVKYKHSSQYPDSTFQVYNCSFTNHKFFAFGSGTTNTHFHHNIIDGGGTIVSKDFGGTTHQTNQIFEYNTIYEGKGLALSPTNSWVNVDFPDDPSNIVFRNNIVYDTATSYNSEKGIVDVGCYMTDVLYFLTLPELTFTENCYYNPNIAAQFNIAAGFNYKPEYAEGGQYSLADWRSIYGYDTTPSIEADPLFVDAPNGDFHLQGGSPAAGMGMYAGTGPQPPGQASNPSPADDATSVSSTADLSWTSGSDATSSDVYFGTDSTPDSGEFQGNQAATTFDPGTLSNSTTYYWRIDEINAQGTTTGNVWSFTTESGATPPGQASNPSPANSAANVSITADLSWTAGSGATSRDVYFGTSSPGTFQGNQTATTYDTGTMANDTTYYWRIDEVNAAGTTTGIVWSFTTEAAPPPPGQASSPNPADSATDVGVGADLSWTAGSNATSRDVYFGTSSPGTFQGNQTATTFDPDTMDNDTTYYWRIDEINATGTTTGVVWSFTTVTAGGQVVEEFGDATNTDHPGTIADTYTNAGAATTNSSTETALNTYTWPVDVIANTTIIKWDLSSIPTDATVIDATLYLYQIETGGDTSYDLPVHKIINVNPVITTCTWNTYDGTNSWTGGADGGQSDIAAAEDLQVVNATNNVYKTWSVTNMVADWVAAPSGNYGMLLNSDDVASVDSHRFFASNEVTNAATRPKLIVTYSAGVAPPDQASSPSPADSATDVSTTADLSWTAGTNSTSSDVYFGTSSPGTFQGNQTATTFEPGTMANSTTYYWRIDEINLGGTTTGNVWSFTTTATAPTNECDNWQTLHPEWIFCDDFESTDPMVGTGRYYEYDSDGGDFVPTAGIGVDNSRAMRTIFQSAEVGAGSFKLGFGRVPSSYFDKGIRNTEDFSEIYYRIYLKMQNGWQGNPQKLSRATVFAASDWSQAMIAHHWGSGSYYIAVDPVSCVNASSQVVCVGYNDFANMEWLGGQAGTTPIFDSENDDIWHYVEHHIKLNDPGQANGIQESWIDGTLDARRDNLDFVTSYTAYAINAVLIENYWDTGSPQLQERYFDNFVVSTQPIGEWTGGGPTPPGQASNPSPADSATDVDIDADLSWTAGSGSTSSDVYFGTTSPGTFQGNQIAATFDPGTMANDTTYYWRIDEINAEGTTTGVVWSFTTIVALPAQASSPSPGTGASDIAIDTDLSWTAGSGATSHDVYFGTSSPGTFQGNQAANTFDTGTMANDTTYYWRIDEVNAAGTTTGNIWSFTTESATGFLPWTDGFESGDLVTGGWTTSGNASASDKAEYTGTYGAQLKGSAWMEKAISTAGFTSIHVKYVRKTKGLDSGEYLYIEYHDGTQWNELEATQATSWASQDKTCGSGADNNADFKIRFRTNANRANEYAYIDDVEITGTSQ